MTPSNRAPVVVFGAACLLVGAILLFIGGGDVLERWRYARGTRAPAVTLDKLLRRATAGTNTSYDIQYRVNPADGPSFEQTESVGVHLWERVERGSPLAVDYLAGPPATARVARDTPGQDRSAIAALGGGALLISIAVITVFKGAGPRRRVGHAGSVPPDAAFGSAGTTPAAVVTGEAAFWRAVERSWAVWLCGLLLLVGLPLFAVGAFRFYDDWHFAREAVLTQGVTLTKEIKRGRNRANRTPSHKYEVTYRFSVSGEPFEGRDQLSADDWLEVVEQAPIDVLYRPARPSSSHLPGRNVWEKTIFVFTGSLCTIAGCWIVLRARRPVGSKRSQI